MGFYLLWLHYADYFLCLGYIYRDVILDPETGRGPKELADHIQAEFEKEFKNQDPLEVEAIRDMNLRDLFKKYGATDTEVSNLCLIPCTRKSGVDLVCAVD